MNKVECVYCLFLGALCGVVLGLLAIINQNKQTIADLRTQLSNPHHCVSVCVEKFNEWGC